MNRLSEACAAPAGAARAQPRGQGFAAALLAAEGRRGEERRTEGGRAAPSPTSRGRPGASGAGAEVDRCRLPEVGTDVRAGAGARWGEGVARSEPIAQAALAGAVRSLPPAVEAFQRAGQAALALDFGGALGVELRAEPGGVALLLAPAPALAAAARAELPALTRALRERGVAVVRAEVRPRGGGGRGR